jgi:hypothetical protein
VRRLTGEGCTAIYGDASHRDTLASADVAHAVALVLSSSSMHGTAETVRFARELNPRLVIFVRSSYLSELPEIRKAGADIVFSGEGEVALAMTEFLLANWGQHPSRSTGRGPASGRSSAGWRTTNPCPGTGCGPPAEPTCKPRTRPIMKIANLFIASSLLGPLTSCDRQQSAEIHAPGLKARKGVVEVEPIDGSRVVAGQTLYVPAYSSVFTADRAHSFNLAVMLSVRNTDRTHPILVTSASYYDQDGQLVRDYLKKPLRIGPMASAEFFVTENDTSGGVSASFLVEWVAEQSVSVPLIEAVMLGTASTQGISFNCPGRVLADRSHEREVGE